MILDRVGKHILNHVDQRDEIRQRYIKLSPYRPFKKKNLKSERVFKVLGMKMIALSHGLNILLNTMPLFVYHALSFISQLGIKNKMHSQLRDLRVGRKL